MQLIYPAHVIAASSFYFARKHTQTIVPKGPDGKEWYEQYHVKLEDLKGSHSNKALFKADIGKDAVMIMVDIYRTLPHLKYQGKYPSHISSPATGQNTPQPNGTANPENTYRELSTSPLAPPNPAEKKISPLQSPSRKNRDIIPSVLRHETSVSPDRKRGRSMERQNSRSRIDSYRPQQREKSRSRSRGHGGPPRKSSIDRYSPERNRRGQMDNYVHAPQRPRKRSVDENARESYGREKRRRDEERREAEEISEGEIR